MRVFVSSAVAVLFAAVTPLPNGRTPRAAGNSRSYFLPRRAADPAAALPDPATGPAKLRRCRSSPTSRRSRSPALIADDARARKMPPWFADPRVGHFSNDPSLSPQEISTLAAWAAADAPAGNPRDAPPHAAMGRRLEHSAARSRRSKCRSRWRFPRTATWNTPTKSCPPDSPKANGCRCPRFARRAARTFITRSSTFARRIRLGCGTRPSACRSPRPT